MSVGIIFSAFSDSPSFVHTSYCHSAVIWNKPNKDYRLVIEGFNLYYYTTSIICIVSKIMIIRDIIFLCLLHNSSATGKILVIQIF